MFECEPCCFILGVVVVVVVFVFMLLCVVLLLCCCWPFSLSFTFYSLFVALQKLRDTCTRVMCAYFFSLSVYYDVVVGAVVMATACDAAATVAAAAVPMAAMFIGFVIFIFFLFAPIVEICTLIFVAIRKHMHCISCSTTFFSFISFFTFVQSTVYCRCPVHSIASTTQHQLCSKIAKRDRSTYCRTLFFLMSICDAVLRQFVVSVLIRFVFFLFILFSASLMPCCYFL